MEAIKILVEEHLLIKEFLDQLQIACDKIVQNQPIPREFFEKALTFAREFADSYHHYKEEYVMFARLAQKNDGAIDAEVELLRNQHEQGRNHLQKISDSLDGYFSGLNEPTRLLHRNLDDYIKMLRPHIHVEDVVFYPMVEKIFTEDEAADLLSEFKRFGEKNNPNEMEEKRLLVSELTAMLG